MVWDKMWGDSHIVTFCVFGCSLLKEQIHARNCDGSKLSCRSAVWKCKFSKGLEGSIAHDCLNDHVGIQCDKIQNSPYISYISRGIFGIFQLRCNKCTNYWCHYWLNNNTHTEKYANHWFIFDSQRQERGCSILSFINLVKKKPKTVQKARDQQMLTWNFDVNLQREAFPKSMVAKVKESQKNVFSMTRRKYLRLLCWASSPVWRVRCSTMLSSLLSSTKEWQPVAKKNISPFWNRECELDFQKMDRSRWQETLITYTEPEHGVQGPGKRPVEIVDPAPKWISGAGLVFHVLLHHKRWLQKLNTTTQINFFLT